MKKNNIIIFFLIFFLTTGMVVFNYTNQLVALLVEGAAPNPGHSLSEIEGWENIIKSNSEGNVGIGTINPSQKLDVSGSAQIRGHIYDASGNLIYDNSTKKIPRERLPFNQSDIISTAGGSYNVASLYPANVKQGVSFGIGQIGTYSGPVSDVYVKTGTNPTCASGETTLTHYWLPRSCSWGRSGPCSSGSCCSGTCSCSVSGNVWSLNPPYTCNRWTSCGCNTCSWNFQCHSSAPPSSGSKKRCCIQAHSCTNNQWTKVVCLKS